MYGFDRQKMFMAGYMVGSSRLSQEYKRYDEKNIGYGDTSLANGKWDQFHSVISLQQKGRAYESTYFLLYDYYATDLSINSRFNYKL